MYSQAERNSLLGMDQHLEIQVPSLLGIYLFAHASKTEGGSMVYAGRHCDPK